MDEVIDEKYYLIGLMADFFWKDKGEPWNWLFENPNFKKIIGEENYDFLLNANYTKTEDRDKVKELFKRILGYELYRWKALDVLESTKLGDMQIEMACLSLADLSLDCHELIPPVFCGYASEWERLGSLEFYKDRIKIDLESLYRSLVESRS